LVRSGVLKESVELAGDGALEAASDVAFALASAMRRVVSAWVGA
jgi:hypothetical protein